MKLSEEILVKANSLSRITSNFSHKINGLSQDHKTELFNSLLKDIVSLRFVFGIDDVYGDEYFLLVVIYLGLLEKGGYVEEVDSIQISSKWPQVDFEKKRKFVDSMKKFEENPMRLNSLRLLQRLKLIDLYNNTVQFITNVSVEISKIKSINSRLDQDISIKLNTLIANSNKNDQSCIENEIIKMVSNSKLEVENGKIKIPELNDFKLLISRHQSQISRFDEDAIKNFAYSTKHLTSLRVDIRSLEVKLKLLKNINDVSFIFEIIFSQIRSYNYLYSIVMNQFNAILNNRKFEYFEFHSMLDEIGVYQTSSEKTTSKILEKIVENQISISDRLKRISFQLNSISDNLILINENVKEVTKSIFSLEESLKAVYCNLNMGLNTIDKNIGIGFELLDNSLIEINSTLSYSNLLESINTYEIYELNSKITKLLA